MTSHWGLIAVAVAHTTFLLKLRQEDVRSRERQTKQWRYINSKLDSSVLLDQASS